MLTSRDRVSSNLGMSAIGRNQTFTKRLLSAISGQSTNEKNPAHRPITHWAAGSTRRSLVYSADNDLDNSGQDEGIIGGVMGRKLYVGNLPYSATEQTLRETFSQCGTVDSVTMITDRDTGRSKGFGFVEMSSDSEAQKAIQELNGSTLEDRQIKVNEAKPKAPRGGGGYGGGSDRR